MNWRDHIVFDKDVLFGKPTIKGTRLSVEHILMLLTGGWTREELLQNYRRLTDEDITAVYAYLTELNAAFGTPEQSSLAA